MRRMILAKGMGAALALTVMAGFVGQASAGLREYCDSYARDVANRKTNGGAVGTIQGGGVGGTVLGAGVTSDRYKRAYTNAYERCVNNYEGARARDAAAGDVATDDQKVIDKKAVASEPIDKQAVASEPIDKQAAGSEPIDKKAAASEVTDKKVAANEVTDKTEQKVTNKRAAASQPTEKKVAASEATKTKVAANEATDKAKACARKYRSFDPQTGKYKSLSGKWRPCRL